MTRPDPLPGAFGSAAVAFCAGAGVLALEITAARVLVPYFGASIVVWSNVIGVTLLSVAAGNFLGGRIADRWPSGRCLGGLLVGAGAFAAAFPWIATALAARYLPSDLPLDIAFSMLGKGSFVVALAALAPPLVLVGATSPFLVRAMASDGRVARAAGWIAGSGTLGSLVGTWIPVHWTIPEYGSRATCVFAGALLVLAGALCARRSRAAATVAGFLFVALAIGAAGIAGSPFGRVSNDAGVLAEIETPYQYARVDRVADSTLLRLNEGLDSFHSMTVEGEILTGAYYDPFLLLPALLEGTGETLDVAILGFAAGTWARQLLATYPDRADLRIVGIELDPAIVELGRRYFGGLDDPRLTVIDDVDARVFLDATEERFDLILVDTYSSQVYVPFQTCSEEFFVAARARLADRGVLAANLGGVRFDDGPLDAIVNTCASVFGPVLVERFERGRNFILLARAGDEPPRLASALDRVPAFLTEFARAQAAIGIARRFRFDPTRIVLTDDRSAIERLCDEDLASRARSELDEIPRLESTAGAPRAELLEDDARALRELREAVERDPRSVSDLQRLAYACFRVDAAADAIRALDAADAVDPRQAYTAFLRGVIAETRFEFAAARSAYRACLARDPEYRQARDALDALDRRTGDLARFREVRDRLDFDAGLLAGLALAVAAITTALARRIP